MGTRLGEVVYFLAVMLVLMATEALAGEISAL